MSEHIDPQGGGIEVSPEEARFLRGFFRRQALPYMAGIAALCAALVWWTRPDPTAMADDLMARPLEAVESLRVENEALRAELAALQEKVAASSRRRDPGIAELERSVEDARRNVAMIEQRVIASADRRLDALENRMASAEKQMGGGKLASADTQALADRLDDVEMRVQQDGSAHENAIRSSLSRLDRLERRVDSMGGAPQDLPAAPAP